MGRSLSILCAGGGIRSKVKVEVKAEVKMFHRSIRFKITILYMAILAATLGVFSTMLYHNVSNGLYSNMDTLLKSKAGGIAQAVNPVQPT